MKYNVKIISQLLYFKFKVENNKFEIIIQLPPYILLK